MTRLAAVPVTDPDQLNLLDLVADPWTATRKPFTDAFETACRAEAADHDGWINPSRVRARLLDHPGYNPRQLAALWLAGSRPDGFMDTHRDVLVPITGHGSRGNGNKTVPMRTLRT